MNAALRRELGPGLVLGGAALLACWPWLLGGERFPHRDAAFSMVALQHLQRIALGDLPWGAASLGWPLEPGFVQADWMLGQALLGLPLALAGVGMAAAYGWLVFLGLLATAWLGHRAAQALIGPGPHTWLAGAVAGLGPLQLGHAPHVNLVHHELALGGGLLLALGLARGRPGVATAGGAVLGLAFHFGIYMGLHAGLVGCAVLGGAILARRVTPCALAGGLLGAALALCTVAPVLAAYARFAALHEAGLGIGELSEEAWDLAETARPVASAWLHDLLPAGWARARDQDPPNFGYAAGALALVGLLPAWRRGWAWRTVIVAGAAAALLALGPVPAWDRHPLAVSGPLAWLYRCLDEPSLRAPARWLWVSSVTAGLLASLGLATLARRLGPRQAAALGLLAVLVVVGEAPRARTAPRATLEPPAAYAALARLPPGPLLDRFSSAPGGGTDEATIALLAALRHRRPLVGGHWARACPALKDVNGLAGRWPAADAAEALRALGVVAVLEHPPHRKGTPAGARCEDLGPYRLCALEPLLAAGIPAEVATAGTGPVVGVRFAAAPEGARVELRCPSQPAWRTTVAGWRTLARVRNGPASDDFDVFLPRPCQQIPEVRGGRAIPLYAVAREQAPSLVPTPQGP